MLMVALAMFGVFFFVSLYMQNVLRYSATEAGAAFLPMTVLITFIAPVAGRFSDRIGSRWLMGAGMILLGGSLLILSRLDVHSSYWNIFPGLVLGGFGMAMSMTPTTAAVMGSVPVNKAGVGSAVLNSMRQVGGSLGIAVMGAILATYANFTGGQRPNPAQFVDGLQHALLVSAAIAFAAAIVAIVTVRKYRHEAEATRPMAELAA
jgi:MFS family permease